MKYLRLAFMYLKNKYVIVFILFVLWITVIDKNNIFTGRRIRKELKELESQKAKIIEDTKRDSFAIRQLKTNPEYLEKFAREEYGMKKDEEDVFIILKKQEPKKTD